MGELGEALEWSRVPAVFVEARSCFHYVKLRRKSTPSSGPTGICMNAPRHTHTNLRKSPGRSTSPTFLTSSTSSTSSTSRMWSIERDCHSIRLGTLGGARLGRKQEATPALQSPGSQSLMAGLLIRVPARNECVKTAGKSQLIREPVKCSY